MEKKLSGVRKVFSTTLSQSHIRTPGPTKAEKTFRGPKSFFLRSCPRHIFEPLVPRTYSNPWSHESRKNFPGSEKFFSAILSPSHIRTPGPTKAEKKFPGQEKFFLRSCPSHIFEPLVPQKPTKLSAAPKVLLRTHTVGQTPTSQPDLPTLIISYFNLSFPEVQFRIPKLKLRPPKYYNFTRAMSLLSVLNQWLLMCTIIQRFAHSH